MSYFAEHIRFTMACDACGRVEKRDRDAGDESTATSGWGDVRMPTRSFFCCPDCVVKLEAVLLSFERKREEAEKLRVSNCAHDYQPRGLLVQCTKCSNWK